MALQHPRARPQHSTPGVTSGPPGAVPQAQARPDVSRTLQASSTDAKPGLRPKPALDGKRGPIGEARCKPSSNLNPRSCREPPQTPNQGLSKPKSQAANRPRRKTRPRLQTRPRPKGRLRMPNRPRLNRAHLRAQPEGARSELGRPPARGRRGATLCSPGSGASAVGPRPR